MKAALQEALDQAVGVAEIARLAGVGTNAVSNWRQRYQDFPQPAKEWAMGPVFSLAEVGAWLKKHNRNGQRLDRQPSLGAK